MGDILGLGLTHYPLLVARDEFMSSLLRRTLRDPDIPAERKDPAQWPEVMRAEWAHDKGLAAAAAHRAQLVKSLDRCREALDDFAPDILIVFGDDQYENFREEIIPPFCVLAYPDMDVAPFQAISALADKNVWNLPGDSTFRLRGAPDFGKEITAGFLERDIDMSYSYCPRPNTHFPHAIANTQLYLDYRQCGRGFGYPIVSILVNCYGQHVIARRGGMASFAQVQSEEVLDPPGPSPRRCFELGRALARIIDQTNRRVAVIASSSWSHAFLYEDAWHLHPDQQADRALYDALVAVDVNRWLSATGSDLVRSGQQEMLNWFCLLGAMTEASASLVWSELVDTMIFNSNKCFAIYR